MNAIVAVPLPTPDTTPDVLMNAAAVFVDDQIPAIEPEAGAGDGVTDIVSVLPLQKEPLVVGVTVSEAVDPTVSVAVTKQPVGRVYVMGAVP